MSGRIENVSERLRRRTPRSDSEAWFGTRLFFSSNLIYGIPETQANSFAMISD